MFDWIYNMMKPLPDAKEKVPAEKVDSVYKSYRWKMFLGMYFGYVIFYWLRKGESFVRPMFAKEMFGTGLTIEQLGILGTIMYVTYGVGKFMNGILADKCNIRVFMATGLLGASIVNLFFPFAPSLIILYILWGLNGIFQSMGFPPVAKGLVHWFAPKERATKWTIWSSSHTFGTCTVGLVATGFLAMGNWRYVFIASGIIGIIGAIALLFTLTDRPQSVGLPKIEDYKNDRMPVVPEKNLNHNQILVKYVFGNGFLWILAITYVFVYFIRFATLDWTSVYLVKECNFTPGAAAATLAIMPFFGVPGGIVAGWIADKYFKGRCAPINIIFLIILGTACFCCIPSLGLVSPDKFGPVLSPIINGVILGAIGFFVDGPQNLVGGVQTSRVTVQEAASAATGFTGMFGYVGAVLSGVGAAWIIDKFGWEGFFLSCVIACAISICLLMLTIKKEEEGVAKAQEAKEKEAEEAEEENQEENSENKVELTKHIPVVCPHCGAEQTEEGRSFCKECGKSFKKNKTNSVKKKVKKIKK